MAAFPPLTLDGEPPLDPLTCAALYSAPKGYQKRKKTSCEGISVTDVQHRDLELTDADIPVM